MEDSPDKSQVLPRVSNCFSNDHQRSSTIIRFVGLTIVCLMIGMALRQPAQTEPRLPQKPKATRPPEGGSSRGAPQSQKPSLSKTSSQIPTNSSEKLVFPTGVMDKILSPFTLPAKSEGDVHVVFMGDSLSRFSFMDLTYGIHTSGKLSPRDHIARKLRPSWSHYINVSTARYGGAMKCDCYRPSNKSDTREVENRQYKHPKMPLWLTFLPIFGDAGGSIRNSLRRPSKWKIYGEPYGSQKYFPNDELYKAHTLIPRLSAMRPRPTHLVFNCGLWGCKQIMRHFKTIIQAALKTTPNLIFKATSFLDHERKPSEDATRWFQQRLAVRTSLDRDVCDWFSVGTRVYDRKQSKASDKTVKYGSGFFYFPFPAPKIMRSSSWIDQAHFESVVYRDWNQGLWSLITSLPAPSRQAVEAGWNSSSLTVFGPSRPMELHHPLPLQELRTLGLDNISWVKDNNSVGEQPQRVDLDLIVIGGTVTRDLFLSLVYRLHSRGATIPRDLLTVDLSSQEGLSELIRRFQSSLTTDDPKRVSVLRCHFMQVEVGEAVQNCYSTFLAGRIRLSFYLVNKRGQMFYSTQQRRSGLDFSSGSGENRETVSDGQRLETMGPFVLVTRDLLKVEKPFVSHLIVGLDFSIVGNDPAMRFEPDSVFQSLVVGEFKPLYHILWLECPPPNMVGEHQGGLAQNEVLRPLDWVWTENFRAAQSTARVLDGRFKFDFCLRFKGVTSPCEFIPFPSPVIRPEADYILLLSGEEDRATQRDTTAGMKRNLLRFEPRVYHEWVSAVWTAVLGALPQEGEAGFYKKF